MRATRLSWPDQAGVVMLLLFYMTTFVYSPPGMPHVHHEEDIHHGDSCVKDACHISIFHPGGDGACDHKFHFTQAIEDCDLCHSLMPRQVINAALVISECKIEFSKYSSHHTMWKVTAPYVLETDRGPPSLI
jgi:hypothetical protein